MARDTMLSGVRRQPSVMRSANDGMLSSYGPSRLAVVRERSTNQTRVGLAELIMMDESKTPTAGQAVLAADAPAGPSAMGVFTRFALALAAQRPLGITAVQAGCTTAGSELDLPRLMADGYEVEVSLIDDDSQESLAIVAVRPELASATLAALGLVPLRPRTFDIVHCPLLLHRIVNADVMLARLAAALRPDGLLLLRVIDPASAAGFLDRRLPGPLRTLGWRWIWPGHPAPHRAVYEPIASARGIEAFVSRHGLSIAYRAAVRAHAPPGRGASSARSVTRLVAWLSGGRLAHDHDELWYVIRKPEDRFARVLH
jgi:SAM-dependent methyltransferase